jgi:hypothetical protein
MSLVISLLPDISSVWPLVVTLIQYITVPKVVTVVTFNIKTEILYWDYGRALPTALLVPISRAL